MTVVHDLARVRGLRIGITAGQSFCYGCRFLGEAPQRGASHLWCRLFEETPAYDHDARPPHEGALRLAACRGAEVIR